MPREPSTQKEKSARVAQQTEQRGNIHRRVHWIKSLFENRKSSFTEINYQLMLDFNDDMIISGLSDATRFKNLTLFSKFSQLINVEWKNITEVQLRKLVSTLMVNHGDNGKETSYTHGMKQVLKQIVRFANTRNRNKDPDDEELKIIKFLRRTKKPQCKITREDLPTDEEISKILAVCGNSTRDKAMFAVHAEAGTRIGELLGLKIRDFTLDQHGGIIKVNGKTGVRPIRIVKSVPYVTRWLNDHHDKDNHEAPLWYYATERVTFGDPINYQGFQWILKKRLAQAGITRRITSHMFRHKEITDLANKLTESESRMRHGWEKTSNMPTLYSHLNQEDLDGKMLEIMGVKKVKIVEDPMKECTFCKISYPTETRFCDICSKPLDVADAIAMEKDQEEKMKSMMYELMRKERAKQSQSKEDLEKNNLIEEQKEKIKQLEKIIQKVT